ncbi:MAG TPA: Hsp20/alpha crystallin family protein [Gaiellaceae bacterium]|nr:Hsp20/alpha crystallin family protein [Gaiellaceae bacterium]
MSETLPEKKSETAPARWDPFLDLQSEMDRMQRILHETFAGFAGRLSAPHGWSPPVDVEETDDAYVVEAELPGVRREDVDVELVGNELSIDGETTEKERDGVVRHNTRRTGRFEYRIGLPGPLDAEHVDASLKDGVLTVRVPKAVPAQRKKIELKGA